MIPSRNWFPATLIARAAWYLNFNNQIQAIGLTLGLVQLDLDTIKDDNIVIQFLADAVATIKAYTTAERNYRKAITEGDVGDTTPAFPANMALSLPVTIETGLFERLDTYVNRIRASAGYTSEIGGLLGIISAHPVPLAPEEMKPAIKGEVVMGNIVNVKFVKGKTNGVRNRQIAAMMYGPFVDAAMHGGASAADDGIGHKNGHSSKR